MDRMERVNHQIQKEISIQRPKKYLLTLAFISLTNTAVARLIIEIKLTVEIIIFKPIEYYLNYMVAKILSPALTFCPSFIFMLISAL